MTRIAWGSFIIALSIVVSGCGDWKVWKTGDKNDESSGNSTADTLVDDLDPGEGIDCAACCDSCWQEHVHEQEQPAMPRLVVTAPNRPLGYFAGRDGLLLHVITADAKYMLTIHSVTGALVGPEWWHYDASERGIGCWGREVLPLTEGSCGALEGTAPGVHTIWNQFADPTGIWRNNPAGVFTANATFGELFTYRFGGRNKMVDAPCQLQSRGDEGAPADETEMCGIRLDNASHLPVTMGPDYFSSEYSPPIEIIETTTPIDEL
jgi:hypothetical protein